MFDLYPNINVYYIELGYFINLYSNTGLITIHEAGFVSWARFFQMFGLCTIRDVHHKQVGYTLSTLLLIRV